MRSRRFSAQSSSFVLVVLPRWDQGRAQEANSNKTRQETGATARTSPSCWLESPYSKPLPERRPQRKHERR